MNRELVELIYIQRKNTQVKEYIYIYRYRYDQSDFFFFLDLPLQNNEVKPSNTEFLEMQA